ncbi:MAG TPA: TIM barrel protein [Vicinamibacterales bacterium]|nr:TIM barrel protein [Vicinamibacterales bacterium]
MAVTRRMFVRSAGLGAGALWLSRSAAAAALMPAPAQMVRKFRLAYAPHFGMFREHTGPDLVAQLEFMASEGFPALEDNGMRGRAVADQELIGRTLQRLHMRMGVFVAHTINWTAPTLTTSDPAHRDAFLKEIRESVDIAKRVGATWMTVVPGHVDRRPHIDYQTANVIETLRRAAEMLEPHGLVIVLEPLNTLRNHPGMFLTSTPQAHLICRAVDSPSCKILFDVYHQQITEGNLIPNINTAWNDIAYFQVGDNPGRNEPGTGEINYQNVFRHIHGKGYTGIVGMEHGNAAKGKAGERAVIDAYVRADAW